MYIEFMLPNGSAGQAAAHSLLIIRRELVEWSMKYDIPYTEKTVKYTHRVCFDNPDHYSFFSLTWNLDRKYYALGRYHIVNIP